MEKSEIVDVEKIVEQGKAILKGEVLPKSSEEIKSTLETIGSEVEQVRYADGEKLSETGQAVLKDLEEILVGGAEVTAAIPPETFLHAARTQQKAAQASEEIGKKTAEETEESISSEMEGAVMNLASLLRMLFRSGEFRDVLSDWSNWLKEVLIVQIEEAQKQEQVKKTVKVSGEKEVGQVPTEEPTTKTLSATTSKVTDEQLDKLIGMLEWMQERQEYQTSIGYIFNQLGNLSTILGIKEEGEEESEESKLPQTVYEAMEEAKKVGVDTLKALENWTHRSTDPFLSHLNSVAEHLKSDSRVRSALQSLAHFLANCFNEPGFLNDRKWIREEARDRIDDVRGAIEDEGYKNEMRGLADEARGLIKSLDREPRTSQLKESFRKLLEDLFVTDSSSGPTAGGFRLKTELLTDMGIIVGGLLQRAKYLRVPDIEVHDEDLDFTAHNVILDAAELIPQQFKMTIVTDNLVEKIKFEQEKSKEEIVTEADKEKVFVQLEPPKKEAHFTKIPFESSSPPTTSSLDSDWKTHLKFEVKGIHGHCRNIHFNVRKRSGFPQLTDEGLADLRVWGPKGMLVKVVLRPEWVKEETIESEIHSKQTIGKQHTKSSFLLDFVCLFLETSSTTTSLKPESSTSTSSKEVKQKFKLSIVKAHCEIDELDLDLHGTRRDWFYTVMGPLVRKRVKSALESAVERNLLTLMD